MAWKVLSCEYKIIYLDLTFIWCKELTRWKRPWCWEGLGAGGEGDDRGWDGWMASPTRWAWIWVNSGILWWTGRPGVLRFMGLQRVGHDWATELNWSYACYLKLMFLNSFIDIVTYHKIHTILICDLMNFSIFIKLHNHH